MINYDPRGMRPSRCCDLPWTMSPGDELEEWIVEATDLTFAEWRRARAERIEANREGDEYRRRLAQRRGNLPG
jgi:hypothetical protein